MSTVKTKLSASAGKAKALHLEDEDQEHHGVLLWNLSVLIVPDENFWFAQGLEINYGAQGDSPEDAQKHFQEGLCGTICQHIKTYGEITRLLKFAPSSILKEAAKHKGSIKRFAQVSFHEVLQDEKAQSLLPFDGIEYRVVERTQVAVQ